MTPDAMTVWLHSRDEAPVATKGRTGKMNVLQQFLQLSSRDQAGFAGEILNCDPDFIHTIVKSDTPEVHDPIDNPHIKATTNHGQTYYLFLDPEADLSDDLIDEAAVEPPASLDGLTVPQLRDLCRELELKVSGNKQELIDRITDYQATIADQ